jgi:primosomal protein N'
MYVLDVIPLSRSAPGLLSYRSAKKLAIGTVVDITLRKTLIQGIVVDCVPVADAKELLKSARFMLSKSVPAAAGTIPTPIMNAAHSVAEYHATTTGSVLASLFVEYIKLGEPLPTGALASGSGYALTALEMPLAKRTRQIEGIVSGSSKATLLVAPTLAEVEYWKQELKAHRPLVLSGALAGARRSAALKSALTHTGLIISTPSFSWTPIQKLGTIVVDRVSAGTYTFAKRPYLSAVRALDWLARARSLEIVYGDHPLPLEYRPAPERAPKDAPKNISVADVRRDPEAQSPEPWSAIPEPAHTRIQDALAAGKLAIVLATRKGYAPAVVCRDCGQAQTDDRGVPLSFTLSEHDRAFVTSDGVSRIDAKRPCQRCGSWNLLPLGIGIERVVEEIQKHFPDVPLTALPPEVTASSSKTKKALASAYEKGGIIVGTEALLPWLHAHPAPMKAAGVIASADSLLALPFWRARERFVRLSYFFAGLVDDLTVLTRRPEDAAVDAVASGSDAFWKEESNLRKALGYPPFGTLITVTTEGPETAAQFQSARIASMVDVYAPSVLPSRRAGLRYAQTVVVCLPSGKWPDKKLSGLLSSLPPSARVRIDPESLW